jgi:hypothetical protein
MPRLSFAATAFAILFASVSASADEPGTGNIIVEPPARELPPPTSTGEAAATAASDAPKSRVKITSPVTVFLQHLKADGIWEDVCTAPCEAEVVRNDRYRVIGSANVAKEILVDRPFVEVIVDPPNRGMQALGATGVAVGGLTILIGFVYTMVGIAHADFDCTSPQRSYHTTKAICEKDVRNGPSKRDGGIVAMVVGAAIALPSLYLVATTMRSTSVTEKRGEPTQAFVREPTWRSTTSSAEAATPAPGMVLPFSFERRF